MIYSQTQTRLHSSRLDVSIFHGDKTLIVKVVRYGLPVLRLFHIIYLPFCTMLINYIIYSQVLVNILYLQLVTKISFQRVIFIHTI